MSPLVILIPAAALILGPKAWVSYLFRKHDQQDLAISVTAGEFARQVLDRQHLQVIKVESTDIGDHYDHNARAVRIARQRFDRKTLTALTTAAHEVSHAIQDASDCAHFVWRTHLSKLAQMTGQVGSIVLMTAPLYSVATHRPFPLRTMSTAVFAIVGTGLVAQLAALPSELDASFNRALPILRNGYIPEEQVKDARTILVACSLTYIAAPMLSILNFSPWFFRTTATFPVSRLVRISVLGSRDDRILQTEGSGTKTPLATRTGLQKTHNLRAVEPAIRKIGKPLIRCWLRLSNTLGRTGHRRHV